MKICKQCNKVMLRFNWKDIGYRRFYEKKYCSKKCWFNNIKTKKEEIPSKKCIICNKKIFYKDYYGYSYKQFIKRKYCSINCLWDWHRGKNKIQRYGKEKTKIINDKYQKTINTLKYKKSVKKRWKNPQFREKHSKAIIKACNREEHKKLQSKNMKYVWNSLTKEKRDIWLGNVTKNLCKRPTSLEKKMINYIKKNNLNFKYTGDGSFIIGGKNPDFVNINGSKICIEIGNHYHHKNNYEQKRKKHFAKYGWSCYTLIMDKFNQEKVKRLFSEISGEWSLTGSKKK